MAQFNRKLEKASVSERTEIVEKIRNLTPGAEVIIANLGLGDSQ